MSWQEKVERYQRAQEEAVLAAKEERLRILKEKLPPLLEVLERFNCRELLTPIRDGVWDLGEVSLVYPDLERIATHPNMYRLYTEARLSASWPFYRYGSSGIDGRGETDPSIGIFYTESSIQVGYERCYYEPFRFEGEIRMWVVRDGYFVELSDPKGKWLVRTGEPDAKSTLEALLLEDLIIRSKNTAYVKLPYSQYIESPDPRVIELIKQGHKPPRGFEYLLDLAQKTHGERERTQATPRTGGFWSKLFGG